MALSDDLLEQAHHLAMREQRRPRQASLRRALSAAYYALFHRLIGEGASLLAASGPAGLRLRVERAFEHGAMRDVCKDFAEGDADRLQSAVRDLIAPPLDTKLASVAKAFVELQEARRDADYDRSRVFDRAAVLEKIDQTQKALADWQAVRRSANAKVFLTALLLARHWGR